MNEMLKFSLTQRATLVWLVLIVATAFSWVMATGKAEEGALSRQVLTALLIGVAMVKARLVIRVFMEVREATLPLLEPVIAQSITPLWAAGTTSCEGMVIGVPPAPRTKAASPLL